MRERVKRLGFCFLGALLTLTVTYAFPQSISKQDTSRLERRLHNSSWQVRRESFYSILALDPALDQTKLAVIGLLVRENSYVATKANLTAEYAEYYPDLIDKVSALRDPRSLDALLGCITTGDMATRGLARLGPIAVRPVIARLESSDFHIRQAAASVLSEMLEPDARTKLDDPALLGTVRRGLLRAAFDTYPYVRMSAIEGLAAIGGPEVDALLEKIALEDPYEASMHGADRGVYPVREAARSVLSKSR